MAPVNAKTESVFSQPTGNDLYRDIVGVFAVTVSEAFVKRLEKLKAEQGGNDYDVLLMQTVADRLAEAGAEYLRSYKGSLRDEVKPNEFYGTEVFSGQKKNSFAYTRIDTLRFTDKINFAVD